MRFWRRKTDAHKEAVAAWRKAFQEEKASPVVKLAQRYEWEGDLTRHPVRLARDAEENEGLLLLDREAVEGWYMFMANREVVYLGTGRYVDRTSVGYLTHARRGMHGIALEHLAGELLEAVKVL